MRVLGDFKIMELMGEFGSIVFGRSRKYGILGDFESIAVLGDFKSVEV